MLKETFSNIMEVAESAPKILLLNPMFWLRQWKFVILMMSSFLIVLVLSIATYHSGQAAWLILTLLVLLLALWGFITTSFALAKTDIGMATAMYVESKGDKYLGRIKGNENERVDLDRLEESILPHNTNELVSTALRSFRNIIKEAKNRNFDSSGNAIEPCREETLGDIFKLQSLQKIALWLGILGTFIGLLLAIKEGNIDNVQSASEDAFLKVVNKMFDGLAISFHASLAGLEVAIILGFCILLLRKRHEMYFQKMEDAIGTVLSTARNSINKDEFLSDLKQVTYELEKVRSSFSDKLTRTSQDLNNLQSQISAQNKYIENGLTRLSEINAEFERFRLTVNERQKEILEEIKSTINAVSLRTAIQESVKQAGQHITENMTPGVAQISNQLQRFNELVISLKLLLNGQREFISQNLGTFEKQLREQLLKNTETVRDASARMNNFSAKIDDIKRSQSQQSNFRQPTRQNNISIREFFSRLKW